MLADRQAIHNLLLTLPGVAKIYYQPPSNVQLEYPCVIYQRDDVSKKHADNQPYFRKNEWMVTTIEMDSDIPISEAVGALQTSEFNRSYNNDGLFHNVHILHIP